MEPNQGIKAWQWIVTVIVIVILVILGYYLFKGNGTLPSTEEVPVITDDASSATIESKNKISVSDQYPGNIVYVTSAQLSTPGWIVIHENNNGTPGAIIGSNYFASGASSGKITLSKSTVEGKMYYAMLHSDDGDKKFDVSKDLPVKDSNGNVIMKLFKATQDITDSPKG